MRDRSTLGAAGLVVAALALASLATQPRPSATPSALASAPRHPRTAGAPVRMVAVMPDDASAPTRAALSVAVLRDGGRLDLNRATVSDLELLPGIGPALARRVVEDRARNGVYRSVDDLVRVAGIGPGKLERIHALVTIAAPASTGRK